MLARPPQLVVAHIVDALPVARERFGPAGAHVTAEDLGELRSGPGRRVHPVGDRGDRCLSDRYVGPHAGKHLSADRTVELGDCIGTGGEAQAHHRHVEPFVGLIGAVTERQQRFERNAALGRPAAALRRGLSDADVEPG